MDCHRCEFIRYDGCRYGRCTHPGHDNVVFSTKDLESRVKSGVRPYNKNICPDFKIKKRCSNCGYWIRGKYFSDGYTPASKGRCSLDCIATGGRCKLWRGGKVRKKRASGA